MTIRESGAVSVNLKLAQEFLEVAVWSHENSLYNAAQTNSVNSAIRAKDAIALAFSGRSDKTSDHSRSIGELSRIPVHGNLLAKSLSRILQEKNKYEYQDVISDFEKAAVQLKRAEAFFLQVKTIIAEL